MKAGIVAIGVVLTVLGIFLFITGYQRISAIPSWWYNYGYSYPSLYLLYQNEYNLGQLMEISGGILTAIGLGLIALGLLKKDKGISIPPPS